MRFTVHEETRFSVHEVTRLHTYLPESHYQLSGNRPTRSPEQHYPLTLFSSRPERACRVFLPPVSDVLIHRVSDVVSHGVNDVLREDIPTKTYLANMARSSTLKNVKTTLIFAEDCKPYFVLASSR